MVSKVVLIALVALACTHSAQAFFFLPWNYGSTPFYGGFGNNPFFSGFGGNNAYSNSDAFSFFGPSNANAAAIASGGGFSFGGNNAFANGNAGSLFGPSSANTVAIASGEGFGGNNAVANSKAFGGTGANANSAAISTRGRKLMNQYTPYYYNTNFFPFNSRGFFNPYWTPFFSRLGGNNAVSNSNAFTFAGPANANAAAIATGNNGGLLGGIFGSRNSATANADAVSLLGTADANAAAIATGGNSGIFGGGGNSASSRASAFGARGANANSVSIAGP